MNIELERCRKKYAADKSLDGTTLPGKFSSLIDAIHDTTGRKIVVLVDEYDKPLLETMFINEAQEEKNRILLKSFFSVWKDKDFYLQFVFFTGVTKFSKISIFSDLNQLKDISLSDKYAAICGITEKDLNASFSNETEALAEKNQLTKDECYQKLRKKYDGYRFSRNGEALYNPYSLFNAFSDLYFGSYWFDSSTPTFLINSLQKSAYQIDKILPTGKFSDFLKFQSSGS